MKKVAFFDTKPYDKESFDRANKDYEIIYFDSRLEERSAVLAKGCEAVCAFVNDDVNAGVIRTLCELGVKVLVMRCAGYSNVDFKEAYGKLHVLRVPAYSPYAVAEHAMALLLTLNRKIHKAYNRTRDFNFTLSGLTGMDLHGKTAGIIGTGKIGRVFIDICRGFGMRVIAYDLFPAKDSGIDYVDLDTLLKESDIISLHCPLTEQTRHILDDDAFSKMKKGVYIINTSRGALIASHALLEALNDGTVSGAGLDVYEEEAGYFYEDWSLSVIQDDVLALLLSKPNVLVTSHQAFLTSEALKNIAETTIRNLDEYFSGETLSNEVCYQCESGKIVENCKKKQGEKRCF